MHTIFRYPVQTASIAPGGARRSPTMAGAAATLRRTIKRPGIPPAAAAAAQQPTPNRMHRIVRIALQSKSRIQNMGNLLLWIRLARTGQMISGLLLFCSHRNFHFFFTSHTTFNLHFAPWYPPKCATDREKTFVLRTRVFSLSVAHFGGYHGAKCKLNVV